MKFISIDSCQERNPVYINTTVDDSGELIGFDIGRKYKSIVLFNKFEVQFYFELAKPFEFHAS